MQFHNNSYINKQVAFAVLLHSVSIMNITFHKLHLDPEAVNDFIILQCLTFSLKNELIYLKNSLTMKPLNNPLLSISPPFVRIWSTNFHLRKKMWKSNAYIDTLCIAVALMQDHRTSLKIWQPFYRKKYLIYIAYKSMILRINVRWEEKNEFFSRPSKSSF